MFVGIQHLQPKLIIITKKWHAILYKMKSKALITTYYKNYYKNLFLTYCKNLLSIYLLKNDFTYC